MLIKRNINILNGIYTRLYTEIVNGTPSPTRYTYNTIQLYTIYTIQTDEIKKKLVKTRKNGFELTQYHSKYCKHYPNETTF